MNSERLTYWDEQLGSYILKDKYNKYDVINQLGQLEDKKEKIYESFEYMLESDTNIAKSSKEDIKALYKIVQGIYNSIILK